MVGKKPAHLTELNNNSEMESSMTSEHFGAQLLTLPHIFENHLFTIPDYQRGYAWEKKQVEELLKDIEHLMNDGVALRRHYTGTLVLSREGVDAGKFHVVDGQQRLTTLVILMRILSEHLPAADRPAFADRYLRRGDVAKWAVIRRSCT